MSRPGAAGKVTIARGCLRSALPALALQVGVATVLGAAVGFGVSVEDTGIADVDSWLSGTASLAGIFLGIGLLAALYTASWWLASAARIRYVHADGQILAYRGRRLVGSLDLASHPEVAFEGVTSLLRMFIGLGTIWSLDDDLPRLRCRDGGPWADQHELPAILVLGRARVAGVRERLAAVLVAETG